MTFAEVFAVTGMDLSMAIDIHPKRTFDRRPSD
jgi:hypothetical protein